MPGRMLWIDTVVSQAVASGGSAFVSLMTGVTAAETRLSQMTLMRTILRMDIAATVHDSGEGSVIIDYGIGIVNQASFTAANVPAPSGAAEFPIRGWIVRSRGRVFGFAADQPVVYVWAVDQDLRSRRKLENGEAYIRWDSNALEGAGVAVTIVGIIRQLWLVSV